MLIPGYFRSFHVGHKQLFQFAKSLDGFVVMGIYVDEKASQLGNVESLLDNKEVAFYADKIIEIRGDYIEFLNEFRPDVVIKGLEHSELLDPAEINLLNSYGAKIYFNSGLPLREVPSNSKGLVEKKENFLGKLKQFDKGYDVSNVIKNTIKKFPSLKVLVVGDIIVDSYVDCSPLGMSREDNSLVFSPHDEKKFIGGASIVSAHLSSLGANVEFCSISGKDRDCDWSVSELQKHNVSVKVFQDEAKKTVRKTRFRSKNENIFRLNRIGNFVANSLVKKTFLDYIQGRLPNFDLIVLCDFGYGALSREITDTIIPIAKEYGVLISADSQTSSQQGDITKFKNVDLITPTEFEARSAFNRHNDSLTVVVDDLYDNLGISNIVVTLGEQGVFCQEKPDKSAENKVRSEQLKPLSSSCVEASGAGDAFLAAASLVMASGGNIWDMCTLGLLASAIQVNRVGNIPIDKDELLELISE